MKQIIACVALMTALSLAGSGQSESAPALAQVKTVYVLPKSHGMDQYLANCLTREKVVQVSTDPLKADALLTDHLGAAFDASVKELYPEPKPEAEPAKSDDESKDAKEPAADKPDQHELKSSGMERVAAPTRSRGTIFLVKRGTGEVLWSVYHEPSNRKPKDLDRTAGKIARRLKQAMTPASATTPGGK